MNSSIDRAARQMLSTCSPTRYVQCEIGMGKSEVSAIIYQIAGQRQSKTFAQTSTIHSRVVTRAYGKSTGLASKVRATIVSYSPYLTYQLKRRSLQGGRRSL